MLSEDAPGPIGPYSQAVRAGKWLFVSGSLGMDPEAGKLVKGGVASQTTQALENLSAVLAAAGAGTDDVVKTTIFLADINDFSIVNEEYSRFFGGDLPPARSTVEVARLPKDALVEIEAIAFLG